MIAATFTEPTAGIEQAIKGKRCWYVSCGGAAESSFQLALGEKIPRKRPLENPSHDEVYRRYEGEGNLLVWCTWRLDEPSGPIASSDESSSVATEALRRLEDAVVSDVHVDLPGWDLRLAFSNNLTLRVFCDHLPEGSFDGNWELWLPDRVITVGAGSKFEVESRKA